MSDFSKQPMFGRQQFLDKVLERVQTTGMTAVLGRSQSGKTTLLRHLLKDLKNGDGILVGYAQSTGEPNLLLRSLKDLYTNWLAKASYHTQAKLLWKRNKDSIVLKAGGQAGRFLGKIFDLSFPAEKPLSAIISTWFNELESLGNQLKTGDIKLPTLPHDVAKDLLELLKVLSEKHPVLILDAFEQSNDIETEAKLLSAIVRHVCDWPPLHIVIAARRPEADEIELKATKCKTDMNSASAAVEVWDIPAVDLDEPPEVERLMIYLRDKIPCTRDIKPAKIVSLIDGYGGVIGRWLEAAGPLDKLPESLKDLEFIAQQAHLYRYSDLKTRLLEVIKKDSDERKLCIRIALLPELVAESDWSAYSHFVSKGMSETALAHLQIKGILLEDSAAPSFGHTKRYEAARHYVLAAASPLVKAETCYLIDEFASRIKDVGQISARYLYAMIALSSISELLKLPKPQRSLLHCALSLMRKELADADLVLQAATLALDRSAASVLIAMGLFDALNHAKEKNKLGRRDDLLEELRKLAEKYPDDSAVRDALAKGLYNTLCGAKAENRLGRRADLLEELRKLAEKYPDDSATREQLAKGLFNVLNHASKEKKREQRNALLEKLRKLAEEYADDTAVREFLAKGLANTLIHDKEENRLGRRVDLLDELRKLAEHHSCNPIVRISLAMGLCNTLIDAMEVKDLELRDALLDELCKLAEQYPDDLTVREALVRGQVVAGS
jgi:hypothetical protein